MSERVADINASDSQDYRMNREHLRRALLVEVHLCVHLSTSYTTLCMYCSRMMGCIRAVCAGSVGCRRLGKCGPPEKRVGYARELSSAHRYDIRLV